MSRRLIRAVAVSVVLAAAAPAAALAVAPSQLTVTNLAQPGLESAVPQPPVLSLARGSCNTPFSAQEANTGMSPCAPGSWPAPDGDWRPDVAVAGGDRLRLSLDQPADQVRYAATTTFPRGLIDPAGQPYPNHDTITARDAQPTDDPHVWTVDLPRFGSGRDSPWGGYTFPIVTRAGAEWRNFAPSIHAPRPMRYGSPLCDFYTNPDDFQPGCLLPPGPPPINTAVADRTPPALEVRVPRGQRVLSRRAVVAYVRCDERCTVGLSGRLRMGRRSYKLLYTPQTALAGKRLRLRARLTPRATRALRRTMGARRRARVVLSFRARDLAGNRSRLLKRTIKAR